MPPPTRQASVPRGVRSRVYRRIIEQLQNDPVLQSVIKTWNTWTGREIDDVRSSASTEVHVVVTPEIGSQSRRSVESWESPLNIKVYVYPLGGAAGVASADYCLDLAELIEDAIYPRPATNSQADMNIAREKRLAFQADLVSLGAKTGEIDFITPPSMTSDDGRLVCVGAMRITCVRSINV